MLLQLHQVQEELEHYFLKYQTLESGVQAKDMIAFIEQRAENTSAMRTQLIQVKEDGNGLDVDLINFQWREHSWPQYHLKIINSGELSGQTSLVALKLPLQANNLLPLQTWPPQTADEQGAYWLIDTDLLSNELTHSSFYPEDIAFLYALVHQLPDWLKCLEATMLVKNNRWDEYYQAIDKLKPSIDAVYTLQKS